jgi:hypothetical protein
MLGYLVLLVGLFYSPAVFAQKEERYEARVEVKVDAKDLSERVQRCLRRELGQLPGVVVVESNPEWVISVVGYELTLGPAAEAVGLALSVVVLEPVGPRWLSEAGREIADAQERERVSRVLENVAKDWYLFKDQRLYTGAVRELEGTCEKMVAAFDSNYLKPARQRFQSLR